MTTKGHGDDASEPRRRLLKSVAVGGSAFGLTNLPGKWGKPVVASVVLPAHAQASPAEPPGCMGVIANCPSGYLTNINTVGPETSSFSVSEYPGISYVDGTLQGSGGTTKYTVVGPCPSPCDDTEAQLYGSFSYSFSGGSMSVSETVNVRCGGEAVSSFYYEFNGSYDSGTTGRRQYEGSVTVTAESCKYFEESIISPLRARRGRRFQFGR